VFIGRGRPHPKSNPRSPGSTGAIYIKRDFLLTLAKLLEQSGEDEVPANIARGIDEDGRGGRYMTIELSAKYQREQNREMMAHSSASIEAANIKILYIGSPALNANSPAGRRLRFRNWSAGLGPVMRAAELAASSP
jgi:hypothetical protein